MSLFYMPRVQQVAPSGAAAEAYYLKFFETDGTTQKAVYQDDAFTTPHNQGDRVVGGVTITGIVADANGRFPAIYTTGSYKVRYYDPDDVEIFTHTESLAGQAESFYQEITGNGSQTVFTLTDDLGTDEKGITIEKPDGTTYAPTDFTIEGLTLTFNSAPATGTYKIRAPSLGLGAASAFAAEAENAKDAALTAQAAAEAAQAAAELVFDNFDDIYLGSKSTDPAFDNDGNALAVGMLYWNNPSNVMRVYNGSSWENFSVSPGLLAGKDSLTLTSDIDDEIVTIAKMNSEAQPSGKVMVSDGAGGFEYLDRLPPGTLLMWPNPTPPSGFLERDGSAVSRTTYADLFGAISILKTGGATTSGSATVTMTTTADLGAGMNIEGVGIPTGSTILSVDNSTTITISANASATGSGLTLRILPFGDGDGSTTFDLPDDRALVERGWDNGRGLDSNRVFGSYQADAILQHNHTASTNTTGSHTHTLPSNANDNSANNYVADSDGGGVNRTANTGSSGNHSHTVTVNNTGGSENLVKNRAYLAIIKY